jgi:transcriptional regulator with XRE-family HTH domain
VRALRKSEGWSQAHLAERLKKAGFRAAHPSTVAKIEAGDRVTDLDELAAIGAVFGVSRTLLLGESDAPGQHDVFSAVRRLSQTKQMGQWQTAALESELRDAFAELSSDPVFAPLATEVVVAADALGAAVEALAAIGAGFGGGEVSKGTEAALRAFLQKEIEEEGKDA